MNRQCLVIVTWSLLVTTLSASAADWPQFRGPSGDGHLESIDHPQEWSADKNLAWTAKIPGSGWSSPVIISEKIFITTAVSEDGKDKPKDMAAGAADPRSIPFLTKPKPPEQTYKFEVHCLDLRSGKSLWSHLVCTEPPKIPVHPSNTFATESPAADNDRVYAFFGTAGHLVCLDHYGKRVWERKFDVFPVTSGLGSGSSLALHDGILYLQRDNDERSSLSAIDTATGEDVWTADRDSKTSWSTPYLWKSLEKTELIACGSGRVIGHNPKTGEEIWRMNRISSSFSASPASSANSLFFGSSGPLSTSPLYAVKSTAAGDITLEGKEKSNECVEWSRTGSGPGMASLFVAAGCVYVPGDGILKVFDAATGKELSKQRLEGAKIFVASPWGTEDTIFLLDETGNTFVLKPGPKPETVRVNTIEDTFWSTPAVAGDSLILRGVEGVYCIRQ